MEALFHSYWWLIFPVLGMAMGFYGMFAQFRHKSDMLKLVKSYVDQGKEPPAALLARLDSDPEESDKKGDGWSSFMVFAALAGGFGYFGYIEDHKVFVALAIGFGIASVGTLIGAIVASRRPKS